MATKTERSYKIQIDHVYENQTATVKGTAPLPGPHFYTQETSKALQTGGLASLWAEPLSLSLRYCSALLQLAS